MVEKLICSVCDRPMRNRAFGDLCEDCYADGLSGVASTHRRPTVPEPLPPKKLPPETPEDEPKKKNRR